MRKEQIVTSNEEFCALLRTIRIDKDMTVTALSELLRQQTGRKVSTTAIRRIEADDTSLSLRTLFGVLNALGGEIVVRWTKKVAK